MLTAWDFINKKLWNQMGTDWQATYRHTIDGKTYELRPDSPMWIFPIPKNVTDLNPNITQNYNR